MENNYLKLKRSRSVEKFPHNGKKDAIAVWNNNNKKKRVQLNIVPDETQFLLRVTSSSAVHRTVQDSVTQKLPCTCLTPFITS